eukprot:2218424-Pyramimonas_sp.AAC.1
MDLQPLQDTGSYGKRGMDRIALIGVTITPKGTTTRVASIRELGQQFLRSERRLRQPRKQHRGHARVLSCSSVARGHESGCYTTAVTAIK